MRSVRFYSEALGLRLSDHSGDIIAFLHGAHASDHHLIAFAKSDGPGLHHSSWDVATFDDVGLGMQQMIDRGHSARWGVGRHVLGSNYFRYVRDPWGSFAEYSYDIDFIPADARLAGQGSSAGGLVLRLGTARPRRLHRQSRERGATRGRRRARECIENTAVDERAPCAPVIHEEEILMRSTVRHRRRHRRAGLRAHRRVGSASAAPSGPPIRIGSTLALTGPLASTALVHQLVGEIYVEQINKKNGLLGRPVEWIVKDDQSKPDLARTLYEQLITVDKVDLLMGPYATGAILSAMGVAQRYNKILIHHTFGIPSLAKYDAHFPTWSLGPDPASDVPEHAVRCARRDAASRRRRSRSSRASFRRSTSCRSARAKWRRSAGSQEVVFLEWDFGNRDFGAIAARVKDAKPDFVWVGAIGLEGNQLLDAMKKIDYAPPLHFHMYPAPGPMAQAPEGRTRSRRRSSRSIRRTSTIRARPSS